MTDCRMKKRTLHATGYAMAVYALLAVTGSACGGDGSPKYDTPVCEESNNGGFACRYEDPYSGYPECREYFGSWTEEEAVADCNAIFSGVTGEVSRDSCDRMDAFGCCTLATEGELYHVTWYYGGPVDTTMEVCTGLLDGAWEGRE